MGGIYALHEEVKCKLVGVSDKHEVRRIISEYQAKVEALTRKEIPNKCDTCNYKKKGNEQK